MKKFLTTTKGKVTLGCSVILVIAAIIVTVILISKPEDYRTIEIEELVGQTIVTDVEGNLLNAYEGMHLESGNSVSVQDNANMTLLFDMDKYMFADAGTKFRVEATGNSEKGTTKTRIHLEEGSVLCRIDNKLGEEEVYDVQTPNSVMSVRGTVFRMSIYKDENGENYTRIDVLEGAVKVDLHTEDGVETGEESKIEAGKSALVHSNAAISEFVIGEDEIPYEEYSESMSDFIISTIESGRELCVDEDTLKKAVKSGNQSLNGINEEKLKDHTPGEWEVQVEPTCKEEGVEAIVCTECGEVIESREIEVIEHVFDNWSIKKEATCKEKGEEIRTCGICGEVETREIETTSHKYGEWNEKVAATCTTQGEKERTCSVCGEVETMTTAALGHLYEHTPLCGHITQGVGPYKVGDQVYLYVYINCSRCNATGGDINTYGTVTTIDEDFENWCEFKCPCGYTGS